MAEQTPQEQFESWMDSQSGYIGKTKKAAWWDDYNQGQSNQKNLNQVFADSPGMAPNSFSVGGSRAEQAGRIEGLQRAKLLTGMDPNQAGQEYQQAYGNIKKRTQLADTGSEILRASKAGAVADARNQLQSQGVKGGAALGAVSSVERAKAYDVNNQLVENQRKAESDYMNATKANANFINSAEMNYGAMGGGQDVQAPGQYSSGFGNTFGTVICTELYRQGFYSLDVYVRDQEYGAEVLRTRPHVYYGYRLWADYVVSGMKKSRKFSHVVAFFALPWASHMAYGNSYFGAFLSTVGELFCGILGRIFCGGMYANQKA